MLLILFLLSLSISYGDQAKFDFKIGAYLPKAKIKGCEETSLHWEKDILVFGEHRFNDIDKEEVKFANAGVAEGDRTCDLYWKAKSEGKNKIVITQTSKCPAGKKYDHTEVSVQSLTQQKNELIYDASFTINGEVKGRSHCVYVKRAEKK